MDGWGREECVCVCIYLFDGVVFFFFFWQWGFFYVLVLDRPRWRVEWSCWIGFIFIFRGQRRVRSQSALKI